MNRRFDRIINYKICFLTILVTLFMATNIFPTYALDARIAFSDPSASVGQEVSVTMKISSLDSAKLGRADIMLSYDASCLEFISGDSAQGGAGSIRINSDSLSDEVWAYTLKFKALKPGETSIKVNTWEIYDVDSKAATLSKQGSSKVTITGEATSSSNANLSSLRISPGNLSPEFNTDITEYTATVGGEVEKIAISAATEEPNATVAISGNVELSIGDNELICTVTAQDGQTVKAYKMVITKTESSQPVKEADNMTQDINNISVEGRRYKLAPTFDISLLPEGFDMIEYSYANQPVSAGKSNILNLTIMYLIGDDGSGDFFIYDEASNSWATYVNLNTGARTITVIPLPADVEVPEGLEEIPIKINEKNIIAWVFKGAKEKEYCVIYAMNSNGERSFYRYDLKENTVQRYFNDSLVSTKEYDDLTQAHDKLMKSYNLRGLLLIALLLISIILLALFIYSLLRGRKAHTLKANFSPTKKPDKREQHVRKDREDNEEDFSSIDLVDIEEIDIEELSLSKEKELIENLAEQVNIELESDDELEEDDDFITLDL